MNICLFESELFRHLGEVLMASVGGGDACHELDSVGVTAGAYDIMNTTTITVYPILETITSYGCQGPQVW